MKQYIVDAFTDHVFAGNQAAVCVMDTWPDDDLMQNIAKENNFSETAFAVKEGDSYHLRWFTPGGEIDFCGHATLGASFVIFNYYEKESTEVSFGTQVGELNVHRNGDLYEMDFPAYHPNSIDVTDLMEEAIGVRPLEAYIDRDLMLVLPNEQAVKGLQPDQNKMQELDGLLVIVTAPSDKEAFDSVSRVFAPKLDIAEDPVTGSAHCMIAPYWCSRLSKDDLVCFQASEREGILYASVKGDRVTVAGKATLFSESELNV